MLKPQQELKFMSKIVLCIRFEILGYNFSPFKLLKVDFIKGETGWKKYALETAKSGFFEIQLN